MEGAEDDWWADEDGAGAGVRAYPRFLWPERCSLRSWLGSARLANVGVGRGLVGSTGLGERRRQRANFADGRRVRFGRASQGAAGPLPQAPPGLVQGASSMIRNTHAPPHTRNCPVSHSLNADVWQAKAAYALGNFYVGSAESAAGSAEETALGERLLFEAVYILDRYSPLHHHHHHHHHLLRSHVRLLTVAGAVWPCRCPNASEGCSAIASELGTNALLSYAAVLMRNYKYIYAIRCARGTRLFL